MPDIQNPNPGGDPQVPPNPFMQLLTGEVTWPLVPPGKNKKNPLENLFPFSPAKPKLQGLATPLDAFSTGSTSLQQTLIDLFRNQEGGFRGLAADKPLPPAAQLGAGGLAYGYIDPSWLKPEASFHGVLQGIIAQKNKGGGPPPTPPPIVWGTGGLHPGAIPNGDNFGGGKPKEV